MRQPSTVSSGLAQSQRSLYFEVLGYVHPPFRPSSSLLTFRVKCAQGLCPSGVLREHDPHLTPKITAHDIGAVY